MKITTEMIKYIVDKDKIILDLTLEEILEKVDLEEITNHVRDYAPENVIEQDAAIEEALSIQLYKIIS